MEISGKPALDGLRTPKSTCAYARHKPSTARTPEERTGTADQSYTAQTGAASQSHTAQAGTTGQNHTAQTGTASQSHAAQTKTAGQNCAAQTGTTGQISTTQKDDTPTVLEMMLDAQEKAKAQRDQFQQIKPRPRYSDAPMEAYSRLARAKTPSQAGSAAGYARRRIFQLQQAKRQDSDNARQIQSAINQLQKAASRACKKQKDLRQDQLTEKRRIKLEREKQRRKAARLRLQLNKKRSLRAIRESGYFRETAIANRFQEQMTATEMELRNQIQSLHHSLSSASELSQTAAIQRYASQASPTASAPVSELPFQA